MKKYIEAEKMLKEYEHGIYDTTDLAEMLYYMPAADVVEVVRCKECRHRPLMVDGDVKDPNYNESAWEEDYTCPYLCYEDDFYNCMPPDDGFCNYGERMDEVTEE